MLSCRSNVARRKSGTSNSNILYFHSNCPCCRSQFCPCSAPTSLDPHFSKNHRHRPPAADGRGRARCAAAYRGALQSAAFSQQTRLICTVPCARRCETGSREGQQAWCTCAVTAMPAMPWENSNATGPCRIRPGKLNDNDNYLQPLTLTLQLRVVHMQLL
jgi:hypothetical protein